MLVRLHLSNRHRDFYSCSLRYIVTFLFTLFIFNYSYGQKLIQSKETLEQDNKAIDIENEKSFEPVLYFFKPQAEQSNYTKNSTRTVSAVDLNGAEAGSDYTVLADVGFIVPIVANDINISSHVVVYNRNPKLRKRIQIPAEQ